jgi:hypothetical protein
VKSLAILIGIVVVAYWPLRLLTFWLLDRLPVGVKKEEEFP